MTRVAVALLLGVLAACGGGDGGDDGALSAEDATAAVERAVLTTDDLGEGWSETDPPEDDPFGRCFEGSGTTLATSGPRAFVRDGDGVVAVTRVHMATLATDDEDAVDALLDRFDEESFPECLATAFERAAGESELGFDVGDAEVDDDYVPLDDVRSAHVRIPFNASAPGFDFAAELDLVVVTRGPMVSTLLTMGLGELVDGEDVARWSAVLADRQRLDDE